MILRRWTTFITLALLTTPSTTLLQKESYWFFDRLYCDLELKCFQTLAKFGLINRYRYYCGMIAVNFSPANSVADKTHMPIIWNGSGGASSIIETVRLWLLCVSFTDYRETRNVFWVSHSKRKYPFSTVFLFSISQVHQSSSKVVCNNWYVFFSLAQRRADPGGIWKPAELHEGMRRRLFVVFLWCAKQK